MEQQQTNINSLQNLIKTAVALRNEHQSNHQCSVCEGLGKNIVTCSD